MTTKDIYSDDFGLDVAYSQACHNEQNWVTGVH